MSFSIFLKRALLKLRILRDPNYKEGSLKTLQGYRKLWIKAITLQDEKMLEIIYKCHNEVLDYTTFNHSLGDVISNDNVALYRLLLSYKNDDSPIYNYDILTNAIASDSLRCFTEIVKHPAAKRFIVRTRDVLFDCTLISQSSTYIITLMEIYYDQICNSVTSETSTDEFAPFFLFLLHTMDSANHRHCTQHIIPLYEYFKETLFEHNIDTHSYLSLYLSALGVTPLQYLTSKKLHDCEKQACLFLAT